MLRHVCGPAHVEREQQEAQEEEGKRLPWEVGFSLFQHLAGSARWVLRDAEDVVSRASWMGAGWEVGSWPGASGVWGTLPGHGLELIR